MLHRTHFLLLPLLLLLILACCGQVRTLTDGEAGALRDMQTTWNMNAWQNHSISCSLPGVLCDPDDHVYRLTLAPIFQPQTTGPVPDSIGQLRWLILLELGLFAPGRLVVTGSLPEGIGGLSSLLGLEVQVPLEGPLPNSLSTLTTLQGIAFYQGLGGRLNGTLPQLQNLPNLVTFLASYNSFSGPLPSIMPPSLAMLQLKNNQLSGVLPEWVCNVRSVYLTGNSFTCPLPSCCEQSKLCANSITVPCFPPNEDGV